MVSGVPPFELFYESHKGEVLAFLRQRAGRDRADDRKCPRRRSTDR